MIELNAIQIVLIFVCAIGIDLILGEPPNTFHPVAWLGKLISLELKFTPDKGKLKQFTFGIFIVLLTAGIITALLYLAEYYVKNFNFIIHIIYAVILLKFTFSMRGLKKAVSIIKLSLKQDDIDKARIQLQALVSRKTAHLNKKQIVSAAVESLTENTCDSFVAPLFYFIIFGLPGAVAYRIINTFDAMIGYHGEWEYTGKFAARMDDVLNFIPARVTAIIIITAVWLCRKNTVQAWHVMLRDGKKTQSPNAGLTMSAMAGALGVQLEKSGHYTLGDAHTPLSAGTLDASMNVVSVTAVIWTLLIILSQVVYYVTS